MQNLLLTQQDFPAGVKFKHADQDELRKTAGTGRTDSDQAVCNERTKKANLAPSDIDGVVAAESGAVYTEILMRTALDLAAVKLSVSDVCAEQTTTAEGRVLELSCSLPTTSVADALVLRQRNVVATDGLLVSDIYVGYANRNGTLVMFTSMTMATGPSTSAGVVDVSIFDSLFAKAADKVVAG